MKTHARLAFLALLPVLGCSRPLIQSVVPDEPPTVSVTRAPLPDPDAGSWACRVAWSGADPEGNVLQYRVAVDPPSLDRVDGSWQTTRDRERTLVFPRRAGGGRENHVFAVQAVDRRGGTSAPRWVALGDGNQPPWVIIRNPTPSSLITPTFGPSLAITWDGGDPDGVFTPRPVQYKYRLFGPGSELPLDSIVMAPPSIPRRYAPHFAGWDSTGPDSTVARFQGLALHAEYAFVVVAFDEAGDHNPDFSLYTNILRFRVGIAKNLGPRITFVADGFQHSSSFGGYFDHPPAYARMQIPAGRAIRVSWFADPSLGSDLVGYRWALDPVDPYDPAPRSHPGDVRRWSPLDRTATEVTLGPYPPGPKTETHRLYVEAHEKQGLRSLAVLEFTVVPFRVARELLIVDDTRLRADGLDRQNPPCVGRPLGRWPTAAELDTFLFARGGATWRCYPSGTTTTSGLFGGYPFDTLGTRGLGGVAVPLATLARYRHVVWIVDQASALYDRPPTDLSTPTTALRWMSGPGRASALAPYVQGGGKLWLAGGGGATATLMPRNRIQNDQPGVTFSSIAQPPDLGHGDFLFDLAGWRSEIRIGTFPAAITRFRGRFEGTGVHLGVPERLEFRTQALDPLPPWRTNPGDYYVVAAAIEFLQKENHVIEAGVSVLDTLMRAQGGGLPTPAENPYHVVMTHYHGSSAPGGVVATGFDLWSFRRPQVRQLVDYVLRDLWGITPSSARLAHEAAPRPGGARRPAPGRGIGRAASP